MELKVNAKSDKYWEVELVGEDRSVPSMLTQALHANPDVEFAACVVEHPLVGNPKMVVRTKNKKAADAIEKAVDEVLKQVKEFKTKIKKVQEK